MGWTAFKFSIVSFLIHYMWISGAGLLLASPLTDIVLIVITSIIRVSAFVIGLQGFALVHRIRPERILALASGILLIELGLVADIIGGFIISIYYLNWPRSRNCSASQPT